MRVRASMRARVRMLARVRTHNLPNNFNVTLLAFFTNLFRLNVLDVTKEEEIAACTALIAEIVGDEGLNCVINNAGISHKENLESTSSEIMKRLYANNTIAPAMIIKVVY